MLIFLDLDGTLIDSRLRLYNLFVELTGNKQLNFEQYWALKRNKIQHAQILKEYFSFSAEKIKAFEWEWLRKIERWNYLLMDKPFEDTEKALEAFSRFADKLVIVTSRQNKENTINQVQQWAWQKYISEILVTEHKSEKEVLIRKYYPSLSDKDYIIGDTGKDIETGKKLNLTTIAVTTGFRSREILEQYKPDLIFDKIGLITFSS